ncbi:MAG: peptidoglycan DD-metalloendopeptidase family protein [Ignavibacteria bacterium]|jgi:septal ring factor EnvC (AmiA/AmiB activator)
MVKYSLVIFLLFPFLLVFSQSNKEINERNEQLTKLNTEIESLEKSLNKKTAEEKESISALQNISQQNILINKIINNLSSQERNKQKEISNINNEIEKTESKIKTLREDYSQYIVWFYKHGRLSGLKYIINAATLNQALIRYKYLSYISQKNREIIDNLKSNKEQLVSLEASLKKEVNGLNKLVTNKNNEKLKLSSKKNEKEKLIKKLREDQKTIEEEIDRKRKAEIQIKNLIAKLIEEERARQQRIREEKLKSNVTLPADYNYSGFSDFADLQGKLSWPVNNGEIARSFGENKNNKLNTVTLNYGIDIRTDDNTKVFAVAEGIVSAIEWIPGYGSVVIITHKGEYRTVYGHVTDIVINEGDKVEPGTLIGEVSNSLEGSIIHFEIWNNRNYQNPEIWLVRR